MTITSLTNKQVIYACSLKEKKYRDKESKYLIEGDHLIEMADKNNIECVFTTDTNFVAPYQVYYVTDKILEKISFTKSPQNKIAIVKKHSCNLELDKQKYLLLDNVADPGNVGTIIRSALAFGIDYVVLSKTSVDIYNDKVIRGSQGAFFKCNVVYADLIEVITKLKENNVTIYASTLNKKSINLLDVNKVDKYALIVGNEGCGVSQPVIESSDYSIKIAHSDKIDSLNVSVATAIMLHYLETL